MTACTVAVVDPAATLALRQRVLRPHQSIAEMAAETDAAGLFAVAASQEDRVVSCAIAHPARFPDLPDRADAWRLRGMATLEELRGTGLGGMVLARVLDEARARGGRLIWCSARTPARALYERAGFAVVGEPWEDPLIGPHVRMWREL